MPRGPKNKKRPADAVGNAIHIIRIATGKIDETATTDDGKNAAVALGAWAARLARKTCPRNVELKLQN